MEQYQELYVKGLSIQGDCLISNLRTRFNFLEPIFWSLTLAELYTKYTTWLERIGNTLGIDIDMVIEIYGTITFKNFMLKRAYYSKFVNHTLLTNLLISTGEANLLNKQSHQSVYEVNNALLETRYYLMNQKSVSLYNSDQEDDLMKTTQFNNKVRDGIVKWIRTRKEIPTIQALELEYVIVIGDDLQDIDQYRLILPFIYTKK